MTPSDLDDALATAFPWRSVAAFLGAERRVDHGAWAKALSQGHRPSRAAAPSREALQSVWPDDGASLLTALRRRAELLLRPDGAGFALVEDPHSPGNEVLRWRWLTLLLPPGLLLAAAAAPGQRPGLQVAMIPPVAVPHGPHAHLHLHLKAAGRFEGLWAHCMGWGALPQPKEAPPDLDPAVWRALLLRARLARHLLAAWLHAPQPAAQLVERIWPRHAPAVHRALAQLATGGRGLDPRHLPPGEAALSQAHASLRPLRPSPARPTPPTGLWAQDPLWDGADWPEGRLLAGLIGALAQPQPQSPDTAIEALALQYLRVRCLLYAEVVLAPNQPGLAPFVETFGRLKPYRKGMPERRLVHWACHEPELEIGAVELRSSPETARDTCEAIGHADEATRARRLELAWVVHLQRDKRDSDRPRDRAQALRKALHGTRVALDRLPTLTHTLRGLDLAGAERSGPLWHALPALRALRDHVRTLTARRGQPPLRLTLHAGEDFAHLCTGLRAIHEPFLWHLLERGDRLGHALAAGVDPERWVQTTPRCRLPRAERILDLAWQLRFLTQGPGRAEAEHTHLGPSLEAARQELSTHLAALGPNLGGADVAIHLHPELGSPATARWLLSPTHRPLEPPLLRLWLDPSPSERRNLAALIEVPTSEELPLLQAAQSAIVALLSAWQTPVELNPTSNLLIGNLQAPLDQPMFRLHPLEPGDRATVPVCLSADDPLLFATNLTDEIAYAWAGMVVAGKTAPGKARAWLQEAADTAWRSRFSLPR